MYDMPATVQSHSPQYQKRCGYDRPNSEGLGVSPVPLYGSGAPLLVGKQSSQPTTRKQKSSLNVTLLQSITSPNELPCVSIMGENEGEETRRKFVFSCFLCKKDKNEPIMSSKCLLWKPQGGMILH